MTRTPGTHGFICECDRSGCRERLYIGACDYERLRALGTVVYRDHSRGRTIVARFGEVVAVRTAFSRLGEAA